MAKSKIYEPGKNDFLEWARKMNINASLDMKKAGSASGAPIPTTNGGVQSAVSGVNTPVANSQASAGAAEGTVGRAFEHAQRK